MGNAANSDPCVINVIEDPNELSIFHGELHLMLRSKIPWWCIGYSELMFVKYH